MSLFKKPSELQAKPGLAAMIYGQPGSGKSTLACSAPAAVLFDTDGGVNRINGAHQVPTLQVSKWEEIVAAMEEVKNTPEIKSIIIDTVGKMLAYMEEYIIRTATGKRIEVNRNNTLSLKGFGVRKQMFNDFVKRATLMGKNVIFVAHDREDKRGEEIIVRPDVGGSSLGDLLKELDLVGYMEMNGSNRTISFTPTDKFYAKNACDMPGVINIPVLIDADKNIIAQNDFLVKVINNYHHRITENIENNRRLERLKEEIDMNVSEVNDAATANAFVEWCAKQEHVYNSAAIAKQAISARAKALGLTFDPINKRYNDAKTDSHAEAV